MNRYKIAASVGALFIAMLCAQGAYAQDQGNIAVMNYPNAWAAYDTETMPGMGNDAPRKYLSYLFYGNYPRHLDQFDFLVVMTNFPYEITEGGRASR